MTLNDLDQHSLGSPSAHRMAGELAASSTIVGTLTTSPMPTAKDILIDQAMFLICFTLPFTNPDPNARTDADMKRDFNDLEKLVKQMFPGSYCKPLSLTRLHKWASQDRIVEVRTTVGKNQFGQPAIKVCFIASPIRYLREKLFPNHASRDFIGNDNFLPEPPTDFIQAQHDQVAWMKSQYNSICEKLMESAPAARLDWVRCQHIELVNDVHTPDAPAMTKMLCNRIKAFTSKPCDRVDGFTRTCGSVKDGELGTYQKSDTLSRNQLTLDVNRSKELKESGKFLRDGFKIERLFAAVMEKFSKSFAAVLDVGTEPQAADQNTLLAALIPALQRFVPKAAASDIALQVVRTGEIRFGGHNSTLGDARKKLKDAGAIYAIANGVYKLVTIARLHALADARAAAVNDGPAAKSDQTDRERSWSLRHTPSLESLLARNDELTWNERLAAFAWLLLPGVRARAKSPDDAVNGRNLPANAVPRLEVQPIKLAADAGERPALTP